jgi:hypothetical protein
MTKEVKVTITYKYFLKSTRSNISKSQYFQRRTALRRGINSSMMFVRAPKHFKTGKQHMFLFNGRFIRVHNLCITPSSSTLFFSHSNVIFNSFGVLREFNFTDTVISRISIQSTGVLNLTVYGRCSFFSASS